MIPCAIAGFTAQVQPAAEAPTPAPSRRRPTFHRLGRRIFTSGALARTHAVAAGAVLFYALPCTLWLWWRAAHGESLTPSAAELAAVIALSYVKDITAVPLAIRFRRGVEREAMLIAAFVDAAVWSFTLYFCAPLLTEATGIAAPALPDVARAAIFTMLALGGVVSTLRPLLTAAALVASLRHTGGAAAAPPTRGDAPATRPLLEGDAATAALYVVVQVIPSWIVVAGCSTVLFGGPEMRDWMVATLPTGYAFFYDVAFCGTTAGSLGVFSATLYSRRIISLAQLSALNAAQMSVYLGFLASVYNASPTTYGEVLRLTQVHPFWLFNEAPWL